MPPAAAKDPRDRAAELEAELAQIRVAAVPGPTVRMRVLPPHDTFTRGSVTVGRDPTPVPAGFLALLQQAADEAGVKIEEA